MLMWCWISYMVPHRLAWGFMTEFPIAQIVALVALASFLYSKESKKIPLSGPIVWLLLFYLWMILTYLVHDKTPFVNGLAMKVLKVQFFTLIILAMLTTRERIEQALWFVTLSIAFFGVKGGLFTITSGGSARVYGPPGGFFEGNNELGLTTVMIIPILFYLASELKNKWIKLGVWGAILLCAVSVLGTQSRGAFLAISICGIFLWWKSDKKIIMAIVFLALAPVGYNFMPQTWHDRMDTIFEEKEEDYDGSVKGRLNAWRMAANIASDKVFGGGFNSATRANFYIYAPDPLHFVDFHSIYFQIIGKHGWPGFFIWLMMYFSTWRLASKIQKRCKPYKELRWALNLSRMLQVSLIAYAAGGAFLSLAYFDLPFHFIITVVAINTIVNREIKALKEKPSEESPSSTLMLKT